MFRNPKTGRYIKAGGRTHMDLMKDPLYASVLPQNGQTIINPETGRPITMNGPTHKKITQGQSIRTKRYVTNPETGRRISVGGPTWIKLKNKGHNVDKLRPSKENKYCRCVLHVASKQTKACLQGKSWRQKVNGKSCYNPYAVCASSVGTTSNTCGENYNFSELPDNELKAYAYLNNISVLQPYNRSMVLDNIQSWKKSE